MTRGRLAVHAHSTSRRASTVDRGGARRAFGRAVPRLEPARRCECYRPNAERGNLADLWNLGPTLGAWLAGADPGTYARFVARTRRDRPAFHHAILPLASAADRRTEIAWGSATTSCGSAGARRVWLPGWP